MKHLWKKVTAWVLAVALVASGVTITGKTAQAAEDISLSYTSGSQTSTADSSNNVDAYITNNSGYSTVAALISAGYTTLVIGYKVTSYSAASSGTPGVQAYVSQGSNWIYTSGGWTNLSDATSGTISLTLTSSSETLQRFGLQICNVTSATYEITSAYLVYSGSSSGGSSSSGSSASDNTTTVNEDLVYNYASLLQESLYFYDANMCGTDVDECCDLSWRSDCHTGDTSVAYTNSSGITTYVDVSGGYHDAGDHAKFGLPQAYAASVLGMSYYEYGDAFDELGLTDHYKTIMDRFVTYFEKCCMLDSSGNVEAFCYQVGDGNTDHSYWGSPEAQDSSQGTRATQAYFTSSSLPCTDIVCETAAALAIYYVNFKDTDSTNANTALSYAKKLFAYANSNTMDTSANSMASGFYSSTSWADDYALAAAWLYIATGDSSYKTYYNNMGLSGCYWVLSWDDVTSAAMLYAPSTSQQSYVASYVTSSISSYTQTSDNSYLLLSQWGSARYNTAFQFMGLAYDTETNSSTFSSWAQGQMQYLLGNNAGKHCFIVGYNSYSVKYPHHRAASGYSDVSSNGTTTQAHVLLGALVGGPEYSSTSYVDTATDYTQNEVALDYNATLVAAAAGLYTYVMENGSSDEIAEQTVLSNSELASLLASGDSLRGLYSDSSSETETVAVTGISLSPSSATITKGSTQTITATVTPTNATNTAVTWSSSKTSVATVSSSGVVTGVASGIATITATAKDGSGVTASCTVTVKQYVTGINLDKSQVNVLVNGTATVSVASITPSNASDSSVTWSIDDTSVAIISVSGTTATVTARSVGTATITVTANDGSGTAITCSVTVYEEGTTMKADNTNTPSTTGITFAQTSSTITISGGEDGVQYSIDGGATWTDATTFTGLDAYTAYTIYVRYAETDTTYAGAAVSLGTVYTNVADAYTIDVSMLDDATYLAALVDANGNVTATYDATTNTLTLTQYADYTLTGENATLIVDDTAAKSVDVTNATVGTLKSATSSSDEEKPSDPDNEPGDDDSPSSSTPSTSNNDSSSSSSSSTSTTTTTTTTTPAVGESITVGKWIYKVTSKNTLELVGTTYKKTDKTFKSFTIKATLTRGSVTYKITSIAANAFKGYKYLKSVTIGANVKTIGKKAFYGCTSLKKVAGCKKVTTIKANAFTKCTKLETVAGCTKVTTIGTSAFNGCKKLTKIGKKSKVITLASVKTIGGKAFYGCKAIKKVNLSGKKLKSIGASAFYKCTAMTTFTCNSTVLKTIKSKAFYGCKNLKKITLKTTKLKKSTVSAKAFSGIKKNCTFKVPKKKISAYKKIFTARGAKKTITVK